MMDQGGRHLPDLDLPPEVHEVGLLAEVKLPVAVLELGDVVGALAQGYLQGEEIEGMTFGPIFRMMKS